MTPDRDVVLRLQEGQIGLLLRALEWRYDADPQHPEYSQAVAVGVVLTSAIEEPNCA